MAANIDSNLANWSTTDSSNQPDGTDSPDADADLRRLQAVVRKYTRTIGSNIASASTVNLAAATGDVVNITGTTTITGLGTVSAGMRFWLVFADALTLTHHATSLILPGAANIRTASGDVACFESLGSGNWRCFSYQRASGLPIIEADSETVAVANNVYTFTATGGEEEIELPWEYITNNNTLQVFVNGLKQYASDHYTEDDTSHITFLTPLVTGDAVEIVGNVTTTAFIPTDPALLALSGLTPAADKLPYFTSGTAAALADLTSFARTLLALTTAADFRAAIGAAEETSVVGFSPTATRQDVKASRAKNVSYQNSTGFVIAVSVNINNGDGHCDFYTSQDGATWVLTQYDNESGQAHDILVMPGHYYKVVSTGSVALWTELR